MRARTTSSRADTRRAIWNTVRGRRCNPVSSGTTSTSTPSSPRTSRSSSSHEPDQNSTVYVYAIFAVTFLCQTAELVVLRPGSPTERGRRAALTISVSLMAWCSLVIALVPGRDSIGAAAPVAAHPAPAGLQAFATGGEYGTSATYMSEAATRERRGFFSSFSTSPWSAVRAGAIHPAHPHHSHRAGARIRLAHRLRQSAVWRRSWCSGCAGPWTNRWPPGAGGDPGRQGQQRGIDEDLLTDYWKPLLLCFLITLGGTVAFYAYSVNRRRSSRPPTRTRR